MSEILQLMKSVSAKRYASSSSLFALVKEIFIRISELLEFDGILPTIRCLEFVECIVVISNTITGMNGSKRR